MCGKWVPNCALICLGSRVSFDLPLALAPGVFMTGPGCGWSKISRVRAPYDNLDPAIKPLQSPESAVYIMDSLLGQVNKVELPTMSAQRRRAGADEVGRMKQSVTVSSRVPLLRRGHGGRFPRTDTREEDSSGDFRPEVQVVTMKVR